MGQGGGEYYPATHRRPLLLYPNAPNMQPSNNYQVNPQKNYTKAVYGSPIQLQSISQASFQPYPKEPQNNTRTNIELGVRLNHHQNKNHVISLPPHDPYNITASYDYDGAAFNRPFIGQETVYTQNQLQQVYQPQIMPGNALTNGGMPVFTNAYYSEMQQQPPPLPAQTVYNNDPTLYVPMGGMKHPQAVQNIMPAHIPHGFQAAGPSTGYFHANGFTNQNGHDAEMSQGYYQEQRKEQHQIMQPVANQGYFPSGHHVVHTPGQRQSYNPPGLSHFQAAGPHSQDHYVSEQSSSDLTDMALNFVKSFCPDLGQRPYCLPPVNRTRHPDKSSKQLVLGMESEKRVLGSFERFFAERQIPAFMLCHYPISGFLQVYQRDCGTSKRDLRLLGGKQGRDTVTLLLLSDRFSVTVITVSVVSGNSDFAYIHRGVQKAVSHLKRCSKIVSKWLSTLGVCSDVQEVAAFPNLKKAMMQRITKDKHFMQNFGPLCSLHVDDLSAPFEEEWSTPVHKHLFSEWMKTKVMCHGPTLHHSELQLVVGALLSPKLSSVEYMKGLSHIHPIPDSSRTVASQAINSEDVGSLQLTIDGITRGFDQFMDDYVSCYYPNIEKQTYRVPPIHFNIQSFKSPKEFLGNKGLCLRKAGEGSESESDQSGNNEENSKRLSDHSSDGDSDYGRRSCSIREESDFMPPAPSYKWSAHRSGNCIDNAGPADGEESEVDSDEDTRTHVSDNLQANGWIESRLKNRHTDKQPLKGNKSNHNSASVVQVTQNYRSKSSSTSARSSPSYFSSSKRGSSPNKPGGLVKDAFHGVEVIGQAMTKDTRADEGENRVISALEILGQLHGPMFIICGYQYNNYLNKLREEMFSKGEANRPIRAFGQTMRAEHDCLIFHMKYGAIVVCIKAIGDNFTDWNASEAQKIDTTTKILGKALKQLEREEAMIRHVTSDLHSTLACHKLIALPNMTREDVDKALKEDESLTEKINELTSGLGTASFLCLDELPPKFQSVWDTADGQLPKNLDKWWQGVEKTLEARKSEMESKTYRQIIGRYCGLLSTVEVWSPTNPRVEVRSLSQAVHLCAQRFSKLLLLPHQVEALNSNHRRLFLYGPPGSGKTLLLILKAKEWLLEGNTVILLNSRPGSKDGFPYAYGILERLKKMMNQFSVAQEKLWMINIDSLHFKSHMLAGVLPSCCVIMDEVTPASHPIIEHLSCLQLKHIWCAGIFEEDRPVTAHRFHTCRMNQILRCPPTVQSLLKYTEPHVRPNKPYKDMYSTSMLEKGNNSDRRQGSTSSSDGNETDKENALPNGQKQGGSNFKQSDTEVKEGEVNVHTYKNSEKKEEKELGEHDNTGAKVETETEDIKYDAEDLKYDAESLNKRLLLKYPVNRKKEEENSNVDEPLKKAHLSQNHSQYNSSSAQMGLATDGPRPHVIDHSTHSKPGLPMNCSQCGQELADFLLSMVKSDSFSDKDKEQRHLPSKNKFAFKNASSSGGKGRVGKYVDLTLSNNSTIYTRAPAFGMTSKLGAVFDSKALMWSDVLVVGRDVKKDCSFVSAMMSNGIPVEVVKGQASTNIEKYHSKERKLYMTNYKEVTGLERSVIVFVSSEFPDQLQQTNTASDHPDLQMSHCIKRLTDSDQIVLWYVASRCLSSLVIILP